MSRLCNLFDFIRVLNYVDVAEKSNVRMQDCDV